MKLPDIKRGDKDYVVSINYPDILDKVKVDEYIYLYDGTIRAKVIETGAEIKAKLKIMVFIFKKRVNFPNTVIDIDVITKKDEKRYSLGVENEEE